MAMTLVGSDFTKLPVTGKKYSHHLKKSSRPDISRRMEEGKHLVSNPLHISKVHTLSTRKTSTANFSF